MLMNLIKNIALSITYKRAVISKEELLDLE